MVTPRPLKLKSPASPRVTQVPAPESAIASIWVDSGVYHLDEAYEYLVPLELTEHVQVGVRVSVPFNKSVCEGLVISRGDVSQSTSNLKFIEKVISTFPVATHETIDLFTKVANRFAGTALDVVRSAIPPRSARVEKEIDNTCAPLPKMDFNSSIEEELLKENLRVFWALPPDSSPHRTLALLIVLRARENQVLAIFNDEAELDGVAQEINTLIGTGFYARLDSGSERSDRYRDFLLFTRQQRSIALGLRGAIFTPLSDGATLIISHESSPHFYEPRAPRWNARDVGLLRSTHSHFALILTGFSPSMEVARLLDVGWLRLVQSPSVHIVSASESKNGELIPSKGFSIIRNALKIGPVLFLVPSKGYGNAILCSKCRNIGLCDCGGRLTRNSADALPECSLCKKVIDDWRCSSCGGERIFLASRGIDRFTEEIGRAFPNFPIIKSSGEHILRTVERRVALVLATPGAEPFVEGGYSAVVLLEGNRFFGHASLRADERAREHYFSGASLATAGAAIYISMQAVHPIVAALTRWNPLPMVRRELQERENLGLPPYRRFIRLDVPGDEAQQIFDGISHAQSDNRLPKNLELRPPLIGSKNTGSIHLSVPFEEASVVTAFLQEYQKRRNLSKKELLVIHVDPYELT